MASPTAAAVLSHLLLALLLIPFAEAAAPRRLRLPSLDLASFNASEPPSTFFEVDRPIRPPLGSTGPCSTLLLSASFGFTYGHPPATAAYAPPECLAAARARGGSLALAVLEWSADCRGTQYDRIFGVWLSGAELLRSCTAEPLATGVVWSVSRDVTRYAVLLAEPGEVAVFLGNLVNDALTGVYHANLTLHLYFHPAPPPPLQTRQRADLIVPISRSLPLALNDGQWFTIQNATDVQSKSLAIPSNAYRAVLEVFVSFHENDEFWYTNLPNEYTQANNLSAANGAFREVIVKVDGDIVGAVWPFTVIYTGGIDLLLWRPITGIGSFNLPSYDIDITPFLGKLLDVKEHDFGFSVTNALHVWYIDANLHLWLDHKSKQTVGSLVNYDAPPLVLDESSEFSELDGKFVTSASRHVSATGWLRSSYGKVTTTFIQRFSYANSNVFNSTAQVINQTIDAKSGVFVKDSSSALLLSEEVHKVFPLYIYTGISDRAGDEYSVVSLVKLGINDKTVSGGKLGSSYHFLRNAQSARSNLRVKNNSLVGELGKTHQVYKYMGTDGCYFRDVSSRNYTIISDNSGDSCSKTSPSSGVKFSLQ